MKLYIYLILIAILINLSTGMAQADRVRFYLQKVAQGKVDEVKKDLPDLLIDYPDDPGVLLLHAVIIDDAYKAVDIYEKIVKKYPASEFSDEAYWRIVQFYSVKGDTGRANQELEQYRKSYPNSQYLAAATYAVRDAIGITRYTGKTSIISLSKNQFIKEESVRPKTQNIKDDAQTEPFKKTELAVKPKKENEVKKHPETKKNNEDSKPATKKKGTWGLQVGIYSTEESAKSEVDRFKEEYRLKAEIFIKYINDDMKWAVVIGDYTSRDSAEAAKNVVQDKCNCSPIIFEK